MEVWTAASVHVVAWLDILIDEGNIRRSLVVDLARFSMISERHVTAVAEATGLRGNILMPWYLRINPVPDIDQTANIVDGAVQFEYKQMKVELIIMPFWRIALAVAIPLAIIISAGTIHLTLLIPAIPLAIGFILLFLWWTRLWIWYDNSDTGEALFDNLLLHSLYGSGIRQIYKKLRRAEYREIGWTGSNWRACAQMKGFQST